MNKFEGENFGFNSEDQFDIQSTFNFILVKKGDNTPIKYFYLSQSQSRTAQENN